MRPIYTILPFLLLAFGSSPPPEREPLACAINALSEPERDRHRLLSEKLRAAVVESTELANGYELALDPKRLPTDSKGRPFCVVEVAEWVDLESRCCPFLDFGIDLRGKGEAIRLRLTGPQEVKSFLKMEFPLPFGAGR